MFLLFTAAAAATPTELSCTDFCEQQSAEKECDPVFNATAFYAAVQSSGHVSCSVETSEITDHTLAPFFKNGKCLVPLDGTAVDCAGVPDDASFRFCLCKTKVNSLSTSTHTTAPTTTTTARTTTTTTNSSFVTVESTTNLQSSHTTAKTSSFDATVTTPFKTAELEQNTHEDYHSTYRVYYHTAPGPGIGLVIFAVVISAIVLLVIASTSMSCTAESTPEQTKLLF